MIAGRSSTRPLAAFAAAAALAVGCAEPQMNGSSSEAGADEPLGAEEPDVRTQELAAELDDLVVVVVTIREMLQTAAGSASLAGVRASAADALAQFLHEPDDTAGGLFPSEEPDRETDGELSDALTSTLQVARQVDGDLGRSAVEVLRDPIAGDLGAWERDPVGVIEQARAATLDARSIDDALADVDALAADGIRALAWTFLAERSTSLDTARGAADRADAHLEVVEIAIEILRDEHADALATSADAGQPGSTP